MHDPFVFYVNIYKKMELKVISAYVSPVVFCG